MGAGIWWLCPEWHQWLAWGVWQRAATLLGLTLGGVLVYFGWLALCGVRLRHFRLGG